MTDKTPTTDDSKTGYIRYRFAQGEYHDQRGWLTAEQQNEANAALTVKTRIVTGANAKMIRGKGKINYDYF